MRDDGRKFAHLPAFLRSTISIEAAIAQMSDVQGNILRKFNYPRVIHAFVRFDREKVGDIRAWISRFAQCQVPSTSTQLSNGLKSKQAGNVFLSAAGYRTLGYEPPPDLSFQGGMKQANLNDPPVDDWEKPFQSDMDAMVSLWGTNAQEALGEIQALGDMAESFTIEAGEELAGGREHFGFIDGISQPLFLEEEIERTSQWSARTPLQVVLARDPYGTSEQSYGTYAVFRKLEQNVARFESGLREMASRLEVTTEMAGAMVVGRFPDGTPLASSSVPGHGPWNDFAYDDDEAGAKCPFASHVRRSNPRGKLDDVAHTPDWQNRIARRGIPYGRPGDGHVGMLFLCFQSDIASQFELIQNNWCNFPHFPVLRAGCDPLIGQRNSWDHFEGQKWPSWDENEESRTFGFPQCVTFKGGEYFFAPSLSFLKNLAENSK
jgi:Dyp-type peroxidase family